MKITKTIKSIYTSKKFTLLEFLFFLSIPVFIRLYSKDFLPFRHLTLFFVAPYAFIVGKNYDFNSLTNYGLTRKNLEKSAKDLIIPTIFWTFILIVIGTTNINHIRIPDMLINPSLPTWFVITSYAFLSVPIQEIVYRGFLINRIKLTSSSATIIVLYSSIIFGLSHLIFQNIIGSILTTLVSISWIKNFIKYQNLWPIMVSHFIFGLISIYATIAFAS